MNNLPICDDANQFNNSTSQSGWRDIKKRNIMKGWSNSLGGIYIKVWWKVEEEELFCLLSLEQILKEESNFGKSVSDNFVVRLLLLLLLLLLICWSIIRYPFCVVL